MPKNTFLPVKIFILIAILLLQACSSTSSKKSSGGGLWGSSSSSTTSEDDSDGPPLVDRDVNDIPNAIPRLEPLSKYGNPPHYQALGNRYRVMNTSHGYSAEGTASWYGRKFHGQRTSSGEPYDMFGMTAAHRSLPIPTYAHVKNMDNGKEVIVKINDRGPFVHNRVIDLSYAAAKKLGIHQKGTGRVQITAIDPVAWHNQQKGIKVAKADQKKSAAKKGKTTQVAKADKTKKATTLAAKDNKQMYLQLGSFNKKTNAQQLAKKATVLTAALGDVDVHVVPNKSAYQVKIGPMKDKAQAQKLQKELVAMHKSGAKIVYE